jgi:hypothetical protein
VDSITENLARRLAAGCIQEILLGKTDNAHIWATGYGRAAEITLGMQQQGFVILCRWAARDCGPYPTEGSDVDRAGWELMYVESVIDRLEGLARGVS